ncbi:MAG: nitrogen fixation protein NifQ [Fibrobacterota bacterium]
MGATDFVQDGVVELLFGAAGHWSLADAHAVAGILSIAMDESSRSSMPLSVSLGLEPEDVRVFLTEGFPGIPLERFGALGDAPLEISYEEDCLRRLLRRFSTGGSMLQSRMAFLIARRCLRPNHLWQDLGLSSREELNSLMREHFAPLAARNNANMKWKKFLYRMVCLDGNGLCTAPSCAECTEFQSCFGEETGVALLARNAQAR